MSLYLKNSFAAFVLIATVTFGVYANSLNNSFHYDDKPTIVENPAIRSLANIPSFFTSKQSFSTDMTFATPKHYRPILVTTYAINYALGGLNPLVYHLTNILLHILSAFLVYLIAQSLVSSPLAASLAGLIYGLHPIHTEALNYISARSSLLSGLLYLCAFYSFIKFRRTQLQEKKIALIYYLGFLLAFLLAVLSKEIALTLPLVIALYDLHYSQNDAKHNLRKLIVAYVPLIFGATIYLVHGETLKMLWGILSGHGARDLWTHLLTQAKVTILSLLLFLWPSVLIADRKVPLSYTLTEAPVLASLGLIGMLFFTAYRLARTQSVEAKACSLGLLWFFITSLPTLLIPLNIIMQEHRVYLPVAGLALAAGTILTLMVESGSGFLVRRVWPVLRGTFSLRYEPRNIEHILGIALCMVIFVSYGILTVRQNRVWRDDLSLWSYAVSSSFADFRAYVNLGTAYEYQGRFDLAIQSYEKALELQPGFFATHYDLGLVYQKLGKENLAITHYLESLRINPFFPLAHHRLGIAYTTVDQPELAQREFEEALRLKPSLLDSRSALGWLHLLQNRPDLAEPYFHEVLAIQPDSVRDRLGLAIIYDHRHEFQQAIREYNEVLRLDPQNIKAHYHLGLIHDELKEGQKAIIHYQAILNIVSLNPQDEELKRLSRQRLHIVEERG